MSTRTAPAFTLTLNRPQGGACSNWTLASSDPATGSLPHNSVQPISVAAAQRWGADMIARNTPYTFVRWIEDEAGQVWTAELKRIRHDFRLIWAGLPPRVMHARNQDDADEVERRILEGENFVRLYDCNDRPVMIGLSQIQTITYEPTEVDL